MRARAEVELSQSHIGKSRYEQVIGLADVERATTSQTVEDVFLIGLHALRENPCFEWVCEQIVAEMTRYYEARPRPEPQVPYPEMTPEQRAEALEWDARERRLKNLLDRPPPAPLVVEKRVPRPEEKLRIEKNIARIKEIHGDRLRSSEFANDPVLTKEELDRYPLETYLVRGFQFFAIGGRPETLTPASWSSMSTTSVLVLKTIYERFLELTKARRLTAEDQRLGSLEDIAFCWVMRRVCDYTADEFKRFKVLSPEGLAEVCYSDIKLPYNYPPPYSMSFGRDLVLLRWNDLIGTPFEHVPDGPVAPPIYPPGILKSVADGYLPADPCRIAFSATIIGYQLPKLEP